MKIYSPPDNHILSKILFASKLYGVSLQHEVVPYGYKNKQFQEHQALFTSPALEVSHSRYIFGTHSILKHLGSNTSQLSAFHQAEVDQWLQLIERELEPAVGVLILKNNQLTEVREEQTTKAKERVAKVAKILDDKLKVNTFLVGDSLTVADISAFFSWSEVSPSIQKQSKGLCNLQRWAKHISSIPVK